MGNKSSNTRVKASAKLKVSLTEDQKTNPVPIATPLDTPSSLTQDKPLSLTAETPTEVKLTDRSRAFLSNVVGFVECKKAVDETALEVLPHKWMDLHPSFEFKEKMMQQNVGGTKVTTCEELFEVARRAKPIFDSLVLKIVKSSHLIPDEEVKVNNELLMLDKHTSFRVASLAPLKSPERCKEKVENEYSGDYSKLVDVVRCSIVVFTEEQLEDVAQALSATHVHDGYEILRLKNRFRYPLFNGYRDALYSILVHCGEGVFHVCEVQLHLAAVVAHKEKSHLFYEYFRAYFHGSGAVEQRMELLLKIGCSGGDVDLMLSSVLTSCDIERLTALADLVGPEMMGDVNLVVLVRKRLLELDNSLSRKGELASTLRAQGKLEESEVLFREVLDARRKRFGNDHRSTLRSIQNLGTLLYSRGEYVEAEALCREAVAGFRRTLGNDDKHTLIAISNLGGLLQFQGKLAEAELLLREALAAKRRLLGNGDPTTLISMSNLAGLLMEQEKSAESEVLFREALVGTRRQLGNDHPDTLSAIKNLGSFSQHEGKFAEAEVFFREALVGYREQLGSDHPSTLGVLNELGRALQDQHKLKDAETMFREALDGRRRQFGNDHPDTLESMNDLRELLQAQGLEL